MAANTHEVAGTEPFSYYLRNYDYNTMVSDMPILSLLLENNLKRMFYSNHLGEKFKVMVDSSTSANLPDGRVLVTSSGGKADASEITDTDLSALEGIDSNIQEQLDLIQSWTTSPVKTAGFTAENRVSYPIVNTEGGADIPVVVPDAVDGTPFECQFLKKSSILTSDVVVTTVSGQKIGGLTTQVIYGQSESFWIKAVGDEYEIFQDARDKLQDALSRSTSILKGFEISQDNTTQVSFEAGVCGIDNPDAPVVSVTSRYGGQEGITIDGLNTKGFTILGFNPDTKLMEQHLNLITTPEHQMTHPRVAIVLHPYGDGTISAVENWVTVGQNPSTRLSTLLDFFNVIKEGVVIDAVENSNTLSVSSGRFLSNGISGDSNLKAPDIKTIHPLTESLAYTITDRTTTLGTADSATVNKTEWDNSGVITGVSSQKWYNYRVFIPVAGVADNANNQIFPVVWQLAQNEWGSVSEAKEALSNGDDTFTVMPTLIGITALCAIVIVRGGATNLDEAIIRQTDMWGSIGSTAGGAVAGGFADILGINPDAGGLKPANLGDATTPQGAATLGQVEVLVDLKADKTDVTVGTFSNQAELQAGVAVGKSTMNASPDNTISGITTIPYGMDLIMQSKNTTDSPISIVDDTSLMFGAGTGYLGSISIHNVSISSGKILAIDERAGASGAWTEINRIDTTNGVLVSSGVTTPKIYISKISGDITFDNVNVTYEELTKLSSITLVNGATAVQEFGWKTPQDITKANIEDAWQTIYNGSWINASADASLADEYMTLFKMPANGDGLKGVGSVIVRVKATAPSGVISETVLTLNDSPFGDTYWTFVSGGLATNTATPYIDTVFNNRSAETDGAVNDVCVGIHRSVVISNIQVEILTNENVTFISASRYDHVQLVTRDLKGDLFGERLRKDNGTSTNQTLTDPTMTGATTTDLTQDILDEPDAFTPVRAVEGLLSLKTGTVAGTSYATPTSGGVNSYIKKRYKTNALDLSFEVTAEASHLTTILTISETSFWPEYANNPFFVMNTGTNVMYMIRVKTDGNIHVYYNLLPVGEYRGATTY